MREVSGVLLVRLLPPLLLAAAASAALGPLLHWGAGEAVALVAPLLICALAPMATQVGLLAALALGCVHCSLFHSGLRL